MYARCPGGYEVNIINLFHYNDDILFIFHFIGYSEEFNKHDSIQMGSYFRKTNYDDFLYLDGFGPEVDPQTDYKIHCNKNDELIVFKLRNIYIIDFINWTKKVKIPISNRIIKNSYYLNEFCFLLFFDNYNDEDYDYSDDNYLDFHFKELDITEQEK